MRKRLIKLTSVLLIGGASSVALAMPASAATFTATSVKAITASPLVRLAETSTSTGTTTYVSQLATAAITAAFGTMLVATVVG